MKFLFGLTSAMTVALLAGCASPKKSPAPAPVSQAIMTPDTSLSATVLMYNPVARFVVLNFPLGNLPGHGRTFFIYHAGLKAGEAKITGPEHDDNTVADLINGTAQAGDEVREQ